MDATRCKQPLLAVFMSAIHHVPGRAHRKSPSKLSPLALEPCAMTPTPPATPRNVAPQVKDGFVGFRRLVDPLASDASERGRKTEEMILHMAGVIAMKLLSQLDTPQTAICSKKSSNNAGAS